MKKIGYEMGRQSRTGRAGRRGQQPSHLTQPAQYFGVLLNLFQKPPNLELYGSGSAASILVCLLLPKQTVQPARTNRMNEAKVIQKAGAVLVVKFELAKFPTSCLTNAKSAMSMANAMRVRVAARNETRDAKRVTLMWVEKERRRAMNDTMAADGRECVRGPALDR